MAVKGGYGFSSYGRVQYGHAAADVVPQFSGSFPFDGMFNVPVTAAIRFELYSFSSTLNYEDLYIRISEDGGVTYSDAYDGSTFLAPYSGKLRRPDGNRIWVYITKSSNWPINTEIVIEVTGTDEFNQEIVKTVPVTRW